MKCGCNPDWTSSCPVCRPDQAATRVAEYLRQRERQPGLDQEMINSVHSDPTAPVAVLFPEDLRVLLAGEHAL